MQGPTGIRQWRGWSDDQRVHDSAGRVPLHQPGERAGFRADVRLLALRSSLLEEYELYS